MTQIKDTFCRLNSLIWDGDLRTLPLPKRIGIRLLRLFYVMGRELFGGQLNLRAMSLVYTTLLSLVPLLAFSFSLLKGFGVHNQVEPLLYSFLEPLGPKGAELGAQVIGFVENVKVGVLGSIGLGLLLYTVISLLQKIEAAFNYVWRVRQLRSLSQRFSNYLSVILVGPLLVFSALGMTASVMNTSMVHWLAEIEPFGTLIVLVSKLLPYLLVCMAFTFVYIFIPNTGVRASAALAGGGLAGVLWETTGWGFAAFIASSSKYAAIYSSFAIIILLLIWLYLNWLILLLGAQVAFFVQNPQYLTMKRVRLLLSNRLKERLSLLIMYLVAQNHFHNRKPWTADALVERMDVPLEPVQRLLAMLCQLGYLSATADDPLTYLPARDIDTIRLDELLREVRASGESRFLRVDRVSSTAPVDAVLEQVHEGVMERLKGQTLKSMLQAETAPVAGLQK